MSRYIDADAYAAEMKVRQDACKKMIDAAIDDEEKYDRLRGQFTVFVEAKLTLDAMPTVDAVPVAYCQFKKNASGVNRYCTKCGAYLEDREYENHTIKFCYYCGSRVVLESEKENGTAK